MNIVEVLIQHPVFSLNRPFSYLCKDKINIGVRVFIEFNNQLIVGYVVDLKTSDKTKQELEEDYGYELKYISEIIDEMPILNQELIDLSEQVSSYYIAPKISVLHAMLPPALRPLKSGVKNASIIYDTYVKVSNKSPDLESLSKRQREVYFQVLENKQVLKKLLSSSICKKLLDLGYFSLLKVEKNRLKLPSFIDEKAPKLTLEQTNAINAIYYGDQTSYLLEGVTGSGKTEVYLKLAEKTLQEGKNVLFLVPEIALTPMMIGHFIKRFDAKVALFHSELTNGEKYDEYRRIASGDVRIVVGARSAIFAPLTNIGLIVVDEEHSATYKQETSPFYHALAVAEMRAKTYNAKIVFGSATPSLETRARALKGIYGHVFLHDRINKKALPHTKIIDMLDYRNVSKRSVYFSKVLLEALTETLEKKEQAILLVNRRGYASYVSCRNCRYVARCPECGITLTYHQAEKNLLCHHCGHEEDMITECPECHSPHLSISGFGTERAVEQVQKLFPTAKILRLDSDITKKHTNMTKILGKFSRHEADILIGTQMIAKGHDFPNVTLVGVINADSGLAIPSFRASETTFQLIMQAIGRSGRAEKVGRAIIQTTLKEHYAITSASQQNYQSFYQTEMHYRRLAKMPPFTYLLQISLSSRDEDRVEETTITLKNNLEEVLGADAVIIGPSIPLFQVIKNQHERNLIVKYSNYFRIKPKLLKVLHPIMENSQFRVKINIEPYDI